MMSKPTAERPELLALLTAATEAVRAMSPEELQTMLNEQGESLASNYKPGPRQGVYYRPRTFQERVAEWMTLVTQGDPTTLDERIARFEEEALELGQALGQSRADAHALVDYVYDRPVGVPYQELGGVMVTLAALAEYATSNMEKAGIDELNRCWAPEVIAKIKAKRAGRHGRGPLPGADPTPAKPDWVTRCAWVGTKLVDIIPKLTVPERADPEDPRQSLELPHLLFMAMELRDRNVDGETKACRWLGWLQAGLVNEGLLTLADMKDLNLASGKVT